MPSFPANSDPALEIAPTSEAVAVASVPFQSSGPVSLAIAAYSPGIFVGSSRASAM